MNGTQRDLRSYYPWVIVAISFLTVGAAVGCRSSFAVFLVSVTREFQWSRGLTSGTFLLGAVVWSVSAPFIGIALDRLGPRVVMTAGAVSMALGFVISSMTQNVIQYYIGIGIFMSLGYAAMPMATHSIVISNWFVRKRGMAMGIVASGAGFGMLTIVPLAQFVISNLGWRQAYWALALLLLGIIAPLNLVFQRHRPEDIGLLPDSGTSPPSATEAVINSDQDPDWTLQQALRSFRFWALSLGMLTGATPLHLMLTHQVAAIVDTGFSEGLAASVLGLSGFLSLPSMILLGAASDRIGREWAYTFGSIGLIVSITLLMMARDPSKIWMLYGFLIFFAIGFASRQSLYSPIAADLFHGRHFGVINGALHVFVGAGAGIGPWLGGYLFDLSGGNYTHALLTANLLAIFSVILIWLAGPRRVRPVAGGH